MTAENDARYMRMAIDASLEAVRAGNMPYGAVMVSAAGDLVHVSQNNQVVSGDCTGHAETVLVREVCAAYGADKLAGATVYASGEPCAMCAGALFWAKVARVVFGASNESIMAVGGPPTLSLNTAAVLAAGSHAIKVEGPLLEEEAVAVLREKT
ncbi:MAG TPA: nucleoside deaminase [Burkholderiales bacterium]|jgi:tRNA(Arg) A34 adenosine deaminase TadA|nr:nucleoside deaminase [Burkholderiales bacterium]